MCYYTTRNKVLLVAAALALCLRHCESLHSPVRPSPGLPATSTKAHKTLQADSPAEDIRRDITAAEEVGSTLQDLGVLAIVQASIASAAYNSSAPIEKSESAAQSNDTFASAVSPQLLIAILGCLCVGAAACICLQMTLPCPRRMPVSWKGDCADEEVLDRVKSLGLRQAPDVEKMLPAQGGYDCAIARPLSSKAVVRLQLQITEAVDGSQVLVAPLAGKHCVLHLTSVSRRLHAGMRPVPVAFSASSTTFSATVVGGPKTRLTIHGAEVSLFSMTRGKIVDNRSFSSAPDRWKDYVLSHRSASFSDDHWPATASLRADFVALEFQELALFVGSVVTAVGEVHRNADGSLLMRGFQGDGGAQREAWRTSWEGSKKSDAETSPEASPALLYKVLISDDPDLLQPEVYGFDGGGAAKLRECCGAGDLKQILM